MSNMLKTLIILSIIVISILNNINPPSNILLSETFNNEPYRQPYLIITDKYINPSRISKYALYSYNSKPLIIYTAATKTHIVFNNVERIVETLVSNPYYYLINKYLLITSIYTDTIKIYLLDMYNDKIVVNKTITLQNLLVRDLRGIYSGENEIILYYLLTSYALTSMYVLKVMINTSNYKVITYPVKTINDEFYTGNTFYGIDNGYYLSVVKTPYNISIIDENNKYFIKINKSEITVNQTLISKPLYYVDNKYLLLFMNNSFLNILVYDVLGNNYYWVRAEKNINNYVLKAYDIVDHYLILFYLGINNLLIKYIDLTNNNVYIKYLPLSSIRYSIITMDLDGDLLPEPILYSNHNYTLIFTSNNSRINIFWDYLLTPITSQMDEAWINNTTYIVLGLRNETYDSLLLLKLSLNTAIDHSPPEIYVYSPLNNHVYRSGINISVKALDPDSKTYALNISIYNSSNNLVYNSFKYSSMLSDHIVLSDGLYRLIINAWNVYGYMSESEILFRIISEHVRIISPVNNTIVSSKYKLVLLSDSEYGIIISINNTEIYSGKIMSGLNILTINTSSISDGWYYLIIRIPSINYTLHIRLCKDSVPPSIRIYGLYNNSVIEGLLVFNIWVWDKHFSNLSIHIDNREYYFVNKSGNYTLSINTIYYANGKHELVFKAFDKAGNNACLEYIVYFKNNALLNKSYIVIEPKLLNNTFMSGILSYSIRGSGVNSVEILFNDTRYSMINGVNGIINSTISINTLDLNDGTYIVKLIITWINGSITAYNYVWFIDNNPPYTYMRIPVVGVGGSWRNNSVVPIFNPEIHSMVYVRRFDKGYTIPLYINISDPFLEKAVLLLNDSTAYIVVNNDLIPGIFSKNSGYLLRLYVPRDGYYILRLRATDMAGHVSTYVIGFYLDTEPPIVDIIEPYNYTITHNHTIIFKFIVHDNISRRIYAGISIISGEYRVPSLNEYAPLSVPGFPVGLEITQPIVFRRDGVYYVFLLFIDEGMNYVVKELTITIDSTPPRIIYENITSIDKRLRVSIVVNDSVSGVDNITLLINNTFIWSTSPNVLNISIPMNTGIYNVTILVYDKAGNKLVLSRIVKIGGMTETTASTLPRTSTTTSMPYTSISENTTSTSTSNASSRLINNVNLNYVIVAGIIVVLVVVIILIYPVRRRAR